MYDFLHSRCNAVRIGRPATGKGKTWRVRKTAHQDAPKIDQESNYGNHLTNAWESHYDCLGSPRRAEKGNAMEKMHDAEKGADSNSCARAPRGFNPIGAKLDQADNGASPTGV